MQNVLTFADIVLQQENSSENNPTGRTAVSSGGDFAWGWSYTWEWVVEAQEQQEKRVTMSYQKKNAAEFW